MKYALQNRIDNLHLLILNLVFQVYFVQSKSIGSLLKRNETGAILGIFSKISFHTKRKVLEDISKKEKSTIQPLWVDKIHAGGFGFLRIDCQVKMRENIGLAIWLCFSSVWILGLIVIFTGSILQTVSLSQCLSLQWLTIWASGKQNYPCWCAELA